jgi:diguanylate cyclase (GGDEF)-like protein
MRSSGYHSATAKGRIAAGEALGRLMEGLFTLVERAGWRLATIVCAIGIILVAVAITAIIDVVTSEAAAVSAGHLLANATVAMLIATPCLAIALKLVEHLGRTRERLLVEIDRRLLAEQQLRRLATTDDLTGLSNRRHFVERAREAIAVARRYGQWCSFAVIDIDRFKKVNDQSGHQAGDQALAMLADVLKANLRTTDLAARFGGDEFVVLMPLTDPGAGRAAAERIRRAVSLDTTNTALTLTVSVGIASLRGDEAALEELMAHADQALYDAKRSGRNRVGAYPSRLVSPCPEPPRAERPEPSPG